LEKKEYEARKADIWSLGVMLFMMLIGAPPYEVPTKNSPAFHFIVTGQLRKVLLHWRRLRHVTEDALDLLTKIFRYEGDRISMENLLKHPFVQLDSDPLRQAAPKIQIDAKESIDDKVEEVIEDILVNNLDNIPYNTHSTTNTTTTVPNANSVVTINVSSSTTDANVGLNFPSPHGSNNQNVQENGQGFINDDSPTTMSTIDDNKNDDATAQTSPTGDVEIGDDFEIINRQFQTNEANNFRKKKYWKSEIKQITMLGVALWIKSPPLSILKKNEKKKTNLQIKTVLVANIHQKELLMKKNCE